MTILLVEDEPAVRLVLSECLTDAGHDVIEAPDGSTALAALSEQAGRISALVTDLNMPGEVDGTIVAAVARRQDDSLPVIIITGRPDLLDRRTRQSYLLLAKPFTPDQLLSKLTQMLSGSS